MIAPLQAVATLCGAVLAVSSALPLGAQAADVTDGGTADLVIMDDFLFSEPVPQ